MNGILDFQTIVVVADEEHVLANCDTHLRAAGYQNRVACREREQARQALRTLDVGLVLLHLNLPDDPGLGLLADLAGEYPHVPVVVIAGDASAQSAVECMKTGAFDYVVKPLEPSTFLTVVRHALAFAVLTHDREALRVGMLNRKLSQPEAFAAMVTVNSEMLALFGYLEAVARTSQPVLITGETGVGKELLAKAVHQASGRQGPLVAVNVSGLDDTMFSDSLFGHARGAYTGAVAKRPGLVEQAHDGTLFLDEIGDLALGSQVKLLRLLQDGEYLSLGTDVPKHSTARVVLATHQDLRALQAASHFRRDLYYRLISHHVEVPPLRERKDEIPLLLAHFLAEAAAQFGTPQPELPAALLPLLFSYSFPGNIRELRAMVFDAVARLRSGRLSVAPFRAHIRRQAPGTNGRGQPHGMGERTLTIGAVFPTMNEAKDLLIEEALRRSGGNKSLAAAMLGMSRQALNLRERRRS